MPRSRVRERTLISLISWTGLTRWYGSLARWEAFGVGREESDRRWKGKRCVMYVCVPGPEPVCWERRESGGPLVRQGRSQVVQ